MSRNAVVVFLMTASFFFLPAGAKADEISELKSRIAALQDQLAGMQKKVEALEEKEAGRRQIPETMEERLATLEKKLESSPPAGVPVAAGKKFTLGGTVELEFVDTQKDSSTNNGSPHFQLDKAVLIPRFELAEDATLYGEFTFGSDTAYAEEIHLTFRNLPGNSWLTTGLDDRFISRSRITETYPLTGTAFWRYETLGITLGGEPDDSFYWRASLTNGSPLDTKEVAEDAAYKILADRRGTTDTKQAKEAGLGLGRKHNSRQWGKSDIFVFGFCDKLTSSEKSTLQAVPGYGASNDDTQQRFGARLTQGKKNLQLVAEYIHAEDGTLERDGWYIEPSYRLTFPDRHCFNAFIPLLRYNRLDVDLPAVSSSSPTWDREQITLGLITQVKENILLKTEYNLNGEETGSGGVDNDELLIQLKVDF